MHGIRPSIFTPSRSSVATFLGLFVISWIDLIPMSSRMFATAVYSLTSSGKPRARLASTVSNPWVSCSAYAAILLARPMPRPSWWR